MDGAVLVALCSLAGTVVGSGGGILAANRLSNWRIEQLERKVDKHNSLIERMTCAEKDIDSIKDDIKEIKEGNQ